MAKKKETTDVMVLPELVISPERPTPVTGNFGALERVLTAWQQQILALDITEDNMELVKLIKSTAAQRRTWLTKAKTENNRIYFNQPKDLYSKKMDHLIALVVEVELVADKILNKREEGRRNKIQELLDVYRDDFQETYRLDERFLRQVEYRSNYFNKGIDEKARKDDLEQQFKDLKKAQNAYHAGVRLITEQCKKDRRIDGQRFLNMLLTEDAAVVSEQVERELERLAEVDRPAGLPAGIAAAGIQIAASNSGYVDVEAEEVPAAEPVILGEAVGLSFRTDFPGRTKTLQVEISYPCDVGDALTELFSRLRKYGIKTRTIRQPEAVY